MNRCEPDGKFELRSGVGFRGHRAAAREIYHKGTESAAQSMIDSLPDLVSQG
jgi:hypothetical protein